MQEGQRIVVSDDKTLGDVLLAYDEDEAANDELRTYVIRTTAPRKQKISKSLQVGDRVMTVIGGQKEVG